MLGPDHAIRYVTFSEALQRCEDHTSDCRVVALVSIPPGFDLAFTSVIKILHENLPKKVAN